MPGVLDRHSVTERDLTDIKGKTLRGGAVATVVQCTNFALRTGSTVILARLLTPNDFGLVAMVTGVTGFFGLLKDAGLSLATVQRETITHEQVSTLFWVNVALGALLSGTGLVLAPVLVAFYGEPRLFWVTIALAGEFVLTASGVQHRALLQRRMQFVSLGIIDSLSLLLGVTVGMALGFAHLGYWSLVGMTLTIPAAQSLCVWIKSPWLPGLPRRRCGVWSMLHFGGTVTLNTLVVYVAYNADKILLGRFCGADAVGIYNRAQTLINLPTQQINGAIGSVAIPTLSRLQSDQPRLKRYFLQGYGLVLSATIPITLACLLFARELILLLLGPKWVDAVPIFRVLAPTALALALINPFGWLLFAKGQTRRSLLMAFLILPLLLLAYFAGLKYGPTGVAAAYSIMMTLLIAPLILWAKRGSAVATKDVFHAIRKPAVACLLAGAAALGGNLLFRNALGTLARLGCGLVILSVAYGWVLLFALGQKGFYLDLLGHLFPRFKGTARNNLDQATTA
jgi:PST family polysaccharide transporter